MAVSWSGSCRGADEEGSRAGGGAVLLGGGTLTLELALFSSGICPKPNRMEGIGSSEMATSVWESKRPGQGENWVVAATLLFSGDGMRLHVTVARALPSTSIDASSGSMPSSVCDGMRLGAREEAVAEERAVGLVTKSGRLVALALLAADESVEAAVAIVPRLAEDEEPSSMSCCLCLMIASRSLFSSSFMDFLPSFSAFFSSALNLASSRLRAISLMLCPAALRPFRMPT